MMHDYTVMILERDRRKDAARRRDAQALRQLASAGQRPWFVALAARLLRRVARPARQPGYRVPCQPAPDPLNM